MELIVFDLDGTLLNSKSEISDYTKDTLALLAQRNIAYTVATGRALHGASSILNGHGFELPQIFKNGAMVWLPNKQTYGATHLLTSDEIGRVLQAFIAQRVAPFIYTLEAGGEHAVYHPPLVTTAENEWLYELSTVRGLRSYPLYHLPGDAKISNISALGPRQAIESVRGLVDSEEDHLVAYMGSGGVLGDICWLDIHHAKASKGGAVAQLKADLGISWVICFGDSDNDLSMFEAADEAYAPDNAKEPVKRAATAVIGHHDDDGIAVFLRNRFQL